MVETIARKKIDICCLQETRWKGGSAHMINGKVSRYKLFWIGNKDGTGGIGILVAERWVKNILDIRRASDRICLMKINTGLTILTILLVYVPQEGLDTNIKDAKMHFMTFYSSLYQRSRAQTPCCYVAISMVT